MAHCRRNLVCYLPSRTWRCTGISWPERFPRHSETVPTWNESVRLCLPCTLLDRNYAGYLTLLSSPILIIRLIQQQTNWNDSTNTVSVAITTNPARQTKSIDRNDLSQFWQAPIFILVWRLLQPSCWKHSRDVWLLQFDQRFPVGRKYDLRTHSSSTLHKQ